MGMSAPGDIFHQPNVAGAKYVLRAIPESYLHLSRQMDD